MEHHHAIFMGKSSISTGPFSIAFCNKLPGRVVKKTHRFSTIPNWTIVSCGFEASHHFIGRSEKNSPSFWAPFEAFDQKTGTKKLRIQDDFILCQKRAVLKIQTLTFGFQVCQVQHRILGGVGS
jgi:hypothetical protein